MARVLLVDADAKFRAQIREVIGRSGHEVLEAPDASEAIAFASSSGIDLVICDVRAEGMTPLELRKSLRSALASFPVPFVFLTGSVEKDGKAILELAASEYLFLFNKPPDLPKLTRTVEALIGAQRSFEGTLGDASLDKMLEVIETGEESGVLSAYREAVVKKIAFEHGKVTFVGSNDPRERIGQALVKAGLITDADLKEALAIQNEENRPLNVILEKLAKVTAAQVDEIVGKKFRDGVLDLYMWDSGKWVFQAAPAALENPSALRIDLAPIRAEGNKRAPRWKAVRAQLPDTMKLEVNRDKFPAGFPANAGDKRLVDLAARGITIGQIRLELPGQDYAVLVRFSEFLKMQIVSAAGLPGPGPMEADMVAERAALAQQKTRELPPPPATGIFRNPDLPAPPSAAVLVPPKPSRSGRVEAVAVDATPMIDALLEPVQVAKPLMPPGVEALLEEADVDAQVRDALARAQRKDTPLAPGSVPSGAKAIEALVAQARTSLETGDLESAAHAFHGILRVDPSHALARRGLAQVDALLARRAEGQGILRTSTVVLAMSDAELLEHGNLSATASFVLSRLSEGAMPVADLVTVCPVPEAELLEILRQFVADGVVAIAR